MESKDFFNFSVRSENFAEQIWQQLQALEQSGDVRSVLTEHADYAYYTVKVPHFYRDRDFYVVNMTDAHNYEKMSELARDKTLPRAIRSALLEADGDYPVVVASGSENSVADIAYAIEPFAPALTQEIMKQFSHYIVHRSEEAQEFAPIILAHQKAMFNYLQENHLEIEATDIDFNYKDSHEVKAWFKLMANEERNRLNQLPAYNDLDFQPFLMTGHYAIMDYGSDTYFIYCPRKPNDCDNGTWYGIAREQVWKEVKALFAQDWNEDTENNLTEIFYTSHQLELHAISFAQKPQYLIARFEEGKLVDAGDNMDTLNLYQSYIVKELQEAGVIANNIALGLPEEKEETYDYDDIIIIERRTDDEDMDNVSQATKPTI
jgi:hypothetical protein